MKKFLFAFSMFIFNIGAAIAIEFTDGDFVYSDDSSQFGGLGIQFESDGSNVYVKSYTGSSSSVEIPSSVYYNDKSYRVTAVGYQAFAFNNNIQDVDLSGVENIGSQAFRGCYNLSEVTNLKSCKYINSLAFAGTALNCILFYRCLEYLGPGAFSNCTNLSEVNFPGYAGDIKFAGAPFSGCTSLKELNISPFFPSIIREGNVYYTRDDYQAKQVVFISRDATDIDLRGYDSYDCGVFENCSKLKTLILPRLYLNFSVDTDLSKGMFGGCNSLEEIRIYSGDIEDYGVYGSLGDLPEQAVVYVPFGSASNFSSYFPDSKIREFGMSVSFDSKYGKVSHYVADGSGNESLKDLTSGAMIESDFRFNIQPSSDAYIESITINGEDVSTYLNGNDLDLNLAGFGSGKIEIVFGHIPSIYVSYYNYAYGKIYADGKLLNAGDYVIGNGSHYFVVVPNEGYYAQINYGGKVQTLPESNTLVLTPGERTPLNVQFKSNPAAYVQTSGHGEVLYKGKVVKNHGSVYSDSKELKEMDFLIIPDDGCVVEKVTWNSKDCTDALVNHHLTVMPASASSTTLDVTFRSLEEATLTITSPNQHSVTHKYTEGATPEIAFEPASGWELHSVTLNGEPVDFDENNVIVTPALTGANELNAVYVAIGNGIMNAQSYSAVKVTAYNHTINVANKPDDAAVTVYDLEGRLIATTLDSQIAIKDSYRYVVVKVTDQTFKIAL